MTPQRYVASVGGEPLDRRSSRQLAFDALHDIKVVRAQLQSAIERITSHASDEPLLAHRLDEFQANVQRLGDVETRIRRSLRGLDDHREIGLVDIDMVLYLSEEPPPQMLESLEYSFSVLTDRLASSDVEDSGNVFGSLIRRITMRTTRRALEDATDALKAAIVNQPQATANLDNASASATLIEAVSQSPESVFKLGSLLVVKVMRPDQTTAIVGLDLTRDQREAIDANPIWLLEPNLLFERLAIALDEDRPQLPEASEGS